MKYLVVADIHGSSLAANRMQEVMDKDQIDACLLLGDILYHGPRNDLPEGYDPKSVITSLNLMKEKIIAICGNCDSEVDQMVLEFPILASSNQFFLGERKVLLTHGHREGDQYKQCLKPGDIYISGHTHLPLVSKEDDIFVLNPGSLALPKGGNPESYGILDEQGFVIYDVDKNVLLTLEFK